MYLRIRLFCLISPCACAHSVAITSFMREQRVPFNLNVNRELKRLMQVQCASDETDVSDVTEYLYRQYLKSKGIRLLGEKLPGKEMSDLNYPLPTASSGRKQVKYSGSKPKKKK